MTTAIIGTGGLGSAIARQLASGGESLRLSRPAQGEPIMNPCLPPTKATVEFRSIVDRNYHI
jgi:ketopantoate reductase